MRIVHTKVRVEGWGESEGTPQERLAQAKWSKSKRAKKVQKNFFLPTLGKICSFCDENREKNDRLKRISKQSGFFRSDRKKELTFYRALKSTIKRLIDSPKLPDSSKTALFTISRRFNPALKILREWLWTTARSHRLQGNFYSKKVLCGQAEKAFRKVWKLTSGPRMPLRKGGFTTTSCPQEHPETQNRLHANSAVSQTKEQNQWVVTHCSPFVVRVGWGRSLNLFSRGRTT